MYLYSILTLFVILVLLFSYYYAFTRYVVIMYVDSETRIVQNKFTGTKFEQALDHYGWFNLQKITDYSLLTKNVHVNAKHKNSSSNMKKKKLKKRILKLENKLNEFNCQDSRSRSIIQFPEKLCDGGIGRLFPSWYSYNSGRDEYFGLY